MAAFHNEDWNLMQNLIHDGETFLAAEEKPWSAYLCIQCLIELEFN